MRVSNGIGMTVVVVPPFFVASMCHRLCIVLDLFYYECIFPPCQYLFRSEHIIIYFLGHILELSVLAFNHTYQTCISSNTVRYIVPSVSPALVTCGTVYRSEIHYCNISSVHPIVNTLRHIVEDGLSVLENR